MFRKVIVAVAASGLLACAHTQETEAGSADQAMSGETTTTADSNATTSSKTEARPVTRRAANPDAIDARAEAKKTPEKSEKVEPDNTGVNKRDTDDKTLTPMDQGTGNDVKITQEIRKAVVGADGLSFTAKNVKIITRNANVTLRGPVKSPSEKARIDALARSCAGVAKVDNQLEVESQN